MKTNHNSSPCHFMTGELKCCKFKANDLISANREMNNIGTFLKVYICLTNE